MYLPVIICDRQWRSLNKTLAMSRIINRVKSGSSTAVLILDIGISVLASALAALYMRWLVHPIAGFQYYLLLWMLIAAPVSLASFLLTGTYKIVIRHSSYRSIGNLSLAVLIKEILLLLVLWAGFFSLKQRSYEVKLLLSDLVITTLLLIIVRVCIIVIHDKLTEDYERDVARLGIIVYGTSPKSVAMVTRLEQSTHYNVLGFLTRDKGAGGHIIQDRRVYYFNSEDDVERLKINLGIESVLFALDSDSEAEKDGLVTMCLHQGIHLLMSPRIEEADFGGMSKNAIKTVVNNDFIPDGMSNFGRQLKRIIDCCLSAVLLIVFSPLFLICWIAIKCDDGGPAIYKQERIGRFGRPFNIYKFRSMSLDAEVSGPALYSGDNDPRLTKVGRFLREHHLDELPQLFNVFRGDMAFVGWRPERKFYIDQIIEIDPRYYYLYQIRPGVTSYATLRNGYTDSMEKMLRRLEFDLYYLRHRSMWFDIKILWQTFSNIAFGKKF